MNDTRRFCSIPSSAAAPLCQDFGALSHLCAPNTLRIDFVDEQKVKLYAFALNFGYLARIYERRSHSCSPHWCWPRPLVPQFVEACLNHVQTPVLQRKFAVRISWISCNMRGFVPQSVLAVADSREHTSGTKFACRISRSICDHTLLQPADSLLNLFYRHWAVWTCLCGCAPCQ